MNDTKKDSKETRRSPGRPRCDYETVQVSVKLRPDQLETLKAFSSRKHYTKGFENVSATIRSLIDSSFGTGGGYERQ